MSSTNTDFDFGGRRFTPGVPAPAFDLRATRSSFDVQSMPLDLSLSENRQEVLRVQVGSLGLRGVLNLVRLAPGENFSADAVSLLGEGAQILKDWGVRRIHSFVNVHDTEQQTILEKAGFTRCPGEKLFEWPRDHGGRRFAERPGYFIRPPSARDIEAVTDRLEQVPEIAFQSWESKLIIRDLERFDRAFLVAEKDGKIAGVIFGGSAVFNAADGSRESRGTLSHLWVDDRHRGMGVAAALADKALIKLARDGVQKVHLMTNNENAAGFWASFGFHEMKDVTFMEKDV